jgi:hypothetical protein
MTFFATYTSDHAAVHVCDRLVTKECPRGATFDAVANKTVVICGTDGLVCLSHTGRAHVGKLPMDRWMAETITGLRLSASFSGSELAHVTVAEALARIRDGLNARGTAWREYDNRILVNGWLFIPAAGGATIYPVVYSIEQVTNGQYDILQLFPTNESAREFCFAWQPHEWLSAGEAGDVHSALRQASDVGNVEAILVDTVRRVADKEAPPVVGRHVMVVSLDRDHEFSIRFDPDGHFPTDSWLDTKFPISYSPCVITPHEVVAPTKLAGSSMPICTGFAGALLGQSTLTIEAPPMPPNPEGLEMVWQAQTRPGAWGTLDWLKDDPPARA